MNKLKTGKGALKDYNRYLADEYDDYAEEPEENDPISHIVTTNTHQQKVIPNKPKTHKLTIKLTSRWPKYQPDFNIVVASGGTFEGVVGEKMAQYLNLSDVSKVLRTCQYLNRIFSKTTIWSYYLTKSFHAMDIPKTALPSMDLMQYSKYLRGARNNDVFFKPCEELGMRNDGIMFDTIVMEKHMKNEGEKMLARNVVDYMTVKSQKTSDTINKLALQGTVTGDVKISLMKEMNQVCVWVAGYHARNGNLRTIAGVLLNRRYNEETQLVNKAYFLNDRYFVIELDESDGEKIFEVFVIEPEPNWLEKKAAALCRQVLKQAFVEQKIKLRMSGDFLVFVGERENKALSIQILNVNEEDKFVFKSEDLHIDAELHDVIPSKFIIQKSSFKFYLIDKESNVYLLSYELESGLIMKKVDQPEAVKEEQDKENSEEAQRFLDPIRKHHHGIYKKESQTVEYLFLCKEKKFYLMNFQDDVIVHCDLPDCSNTKDCKLSNWTICGNYLYLLLDTTIFIYQLDFLSCSAVFYKCKMIKKTKFNGEHARWILVNPCLTVVVSSSSLSEGFFRSLQLFSGSTQRLLLKIDPSLALKIEKFDSEKLKGLDRKWHYDECRIDNIVGHVDRWKTIGKERIKFKFEDERLLIQTDVGSYFRDFNVYERRVSQEKYGWRSQEIYNLNEPVGFALAKPSLEDLQQKKSEMKFGISCLDFENKNREILKKRRTQTWKNIEKKPVTDEKLERKESKKKGEKYFKNVRQGKHRDKMSD